MNVTCCIFSVSFLHTQSKTELNTLALLVQESQIEQKSIRSHFWGVISGPTEILQDTTQLHQPDDAKFGMY